MGRITIYLDDQTEVLVKAAVKAAGISQSRWVAEVVRERVRSQGRSDHVPARVSIESGHWIL